MGYSESKMYKMDEIGLLDRGLPTKALCLCDDKCRIGKSSTERHRYYYD